MRFGVNASRRALYVCMALAMAAGTALANESLVLFPGETMPVETPAGEPFASLADTRLELRLHHWSVPAATAILFRNAGFRVELRSTGELCALDTIDSLPRYGGTMCADVTGQNDVTMRVQRDTTAKLLRLEVRSSSADWAASAYCGTKQNGTTYKNAFPCPISTVAQQSWAGSGQIGSPYTNARISWIKWFSGVVPAGAGPLGEYTPADLADWRFEGGVANEATGGPAVTIGTETSPSTAGETAVTGVMYMPSATHAPACSAGARQTFRAGFPARLDGSGSYPLDGNSALAYSWSQLTGPSTVTWSGRDSAQPEVTGLVFGSYEFLLTVTDRANRSTSCKVKHGAVASDDNGVVVTNNPAVDILLGPMIRFGANPWPWFDDRNKASADIQIANMDPYYGAYWDIPGPGTVNVTAGSAIVTGSGTSFTTLFCQGPANPSTPKSGAAIVVWYPTGTPGETGRRQWRVNSCQGDNQITLNAVWKNDVRDGFGLNYSNGGSDVSYIWAYGSAPANYYDNVAGLYALYYRSGIDDYLYAARKLADRFWSSPQMDRGAAAVLDGPGWLPARSQSTMGLVLRALDGRPEMWKGLHIIWDTFKGYYLDRVDVSWGPGMWDLREEAYHLSMISYCALFDTDPVYRNNCKASVANSFATIWTPYKGADGSWPQLYYGYKLSSFDTGGIVSLTNGSRTVSGTGTAWTAAQFSGGYPIWFIAEPFRKPATNADGDPATYTATFVSATELLLDRPYEGTTGIHGWLLANSASAGLIGWGSQPFMMGLLASAFDLASRAIEDVSPATSALARSYNVSAANWLKNYGYWPAKKGMYYGAQYVNCRAPISDDNKFCTAGNSAGEARVLNAEPLRGIMTAYGYTGDAALKTLADTMYSAMFSKPATNSPDPDGYYIDALDDVVGWYMSGAPPTGQAPKYFGMLFGFNALASWPAYRVGGLQPASGGSAPVEPNIPAVKGAVRVRLTATAPNGARETAICDGERCQVPVDMRQGASLVKTEYLSDEGRVLRTVEAPAASR